MAHSALMAVTTIEEKEPLLSLLQVARNDTSNPQFVEISRCTIQIFNTKQNDCSRNGHITSSSKCILNWLLHSAIVNTTID